MEAPQMMLRFAWMSNMFKAVVNKIIAAEESTTSAIQVKTRSADRIAYT